MKTKHTGTNIVIAIIAILFAILATWKLAIGDVIITEVGLSNPVWAELFNAGEYPVDISKCKLSDLDGSDTPLANSPTTLLPGQYALIYWATGNTDETDLTGDTNSNGILDLYLEDSSPTKTDDELSLIDSNDNYLDAICWSNNDNTISSGELTDIQNLFNAGQWSATATNAQTFNQVAWTSTSDLNADMSISRYATTEEQYSDTNSKSDWYLCYSPTPGRPSDISLPIILSKFEVREFDSHIFILWNTEAEINNAGFDIYKSESRQTLFQKINSELIKGAGTTAKAHSYMFVDENVCKGHTYYYYIKSISFSGLESQTNTIKLQIHIQNISYNPTEYIPVSALFQNYPNPFNPETWIPFQLAKQANVTITIYNVTGKLIRKIYVGKCEPGSYITKSRAVYWDAKNQNGAKVSSGIYFYAISAGNFSAVKKMIILY